MDIPPQNGPHAESHVDLLLGFLRGPGMGHDWRVQLLLTHGQAFDASSLPDDVAVMQAGSCYLNSYTLALEQSDRFTYYEGYASTLPSNDVGMEHAWCVDREGRVVDPTWANPICHPPCAYLGLPFPLAVVRPYAYCRSSGVFDGWLYDRREEMEIELPRVLGVDPI